MSGFDKEAERQRLREQFEKDSADRKETERMSELLLQGATMTNKHCEVCGDPIFRYQGQEFCATCQGREQDAKAQQAPGTEPSTDAQQSAQDAQADRDANREHPVEQEAAAAKANELEQAQQSAETAMEQLGEQATTATHTPSQQAPEAPTSTTTSLAEAQQSLVRTLTNLTKGAEESDDVGRTKDYLEAAHEAADALCAVKKASR